MTDNRTSQAVEIVADAFIDSACLLATEALAYDPLSSQTPL